MNKLIITFAFVSCAGFSHVNAGERAYISKESKNIEAPQPCFLANEWQVDLYGQYSVGEGPSQVQMFRDHTWGGGVGINYFFTERFGLGVDATWSYGKEGPAVTDGGHTTIHQFTGSLIYRFVNDTSCWAPYIYAGGGFAVDGEQWATAHGGVGIEYRYAHGKGIFVDGRWTYLGDRFGSDDLNFFSTRLGFRFVF